MPPKLTLKERAWGTRYDSLGPSPPMSPQKQAFPTPVSTPISRPSSVDIINTAHVSNQESTTPHHRFVHSQDQKMLHGASVFVGSLPSTVDIPELTRLLREHLSQHAEVKSVKVVRDSNKGGTCAFVQCQSTTAAARLIGTLRSLPPRPFLGRMLRYEPARAMRTLLISYCQPAQRIDVSDRQNLSHRLTYQTQDAGALPTAMRIYQPSGSKFLEITYDEEARHYPTNATTQPSNADTSPVDGTGVLLDPLRFDVENIRETALAFGPIEHLGAYSPVVSDPNQDNDHAGTVTHSMFPFPHDGPRSASMDRNVWEVKWQHRNDCVNALMTLRRVPFLSVSWAHHADPPFATSSVTGYPSPGMNAGTTTLSPGSPRARSQPHLSASPREHYRDLAESVYTRIDVTSPTHTKTAVAPMLAVLTPSAQPWARTPHAPPLPDLDGTPQTSGSTGGFSEDACIGSQKWGDTDFPPFDNREDGRANSRVRSSRVSWSGCRMPSGEHELSSNSAVLASPASSLSVNPSSIPTRSRSHSGALAPTEKSPLSRSNTTVTTEQHVNRAAASAILEFPDRYTAPRTPKSGQFTDISSARHGEGAAMHLSANASNLQRCLEQEESPGGPPPLAAHSQDWFVNEKPHLDPTAIFVGGLDIYSDDVWDESHLRAIFAKYGRIESIQVVRPPSKKSAFAFIKFSGAEAAAKAVEEEHNRVHNGRQIRVQLRDNKPQQRSPWRQLPHRGMSTPGLTSSPLHADGWRGTLQGRDGPSTERSPGMKLSAGFAYEQLPKTRTVFTSPGRISMSRATEIKEESPPKFARLGHQASEANLSSLSSTTTRVSPPTPTLVYDYQSRYTPSATPALSVSSIGPSASVTGAPPPFAMPGVGYFAPPWVHPYAPPYPYSVPFMPMQAYAAAMPPSHPHQSRQGGAAEAPGSATQQQAWSPANETQRPMVPYMPYAHAPQYGDQTPAHSTQSPHAQLEHQPPLRPTGFIQGQHGMLIPVYQPEALHQYMSNTEQGPSATTTQGPLPPTHASAWMQPPHYPLVPYPVPMPAMGSPLSHNPQSYSQKAWMPGPAPQDMSTQNASYQHGPLLLPPSASLSSMPSFNGTYPVPFPAAIRHMPRHAGSSSPRRFHRRDHLHTNAFNNQRTGT